MSIPKIPEPAQIVISVLTPDKSAVDSIHTRLVEMLGPVEQEIGPLDFNFTSYYDAEMGPGIKRWIWAFERLRDRADLRQIKIFTNELENLRSVESKRVFNLDPGVLTLGNFVLATGKNNAHRIYLGDGIFADLTLIFRSGTYRPLEWTYPDYADADLISVLNGLRETYKCKIVNPAREAGP